MMMRFGRMASFVVLLVLVCLSASPSAAQESPSADTDMINLFFDCQGRGCFDLDFFRREIPLVNWVRDREVSDVHVLVTSQPTGGGGLLMTMAFIGQGPFAGVDQELTVSTSGDATNDEERAAVAGRLKMGLVRYLAGTAAGDQIRIQMGESDPGGPGGPGRPGGQGGQPGAPVDDPWDSWSFNIRGNGFLNGESSFSSSSYSGNIGANRTTDAWKFSLSGQYSRRESNFVLSETETVTSVFENWSGSSLLVKSLTPQWSVGARAGVGASSFLNEDLRWDVSPGIEYNFFPYAESSRRSLTLQALLNVRHWDYINETIYEEFAETRVAASLTAGLNQVQPWGRTSISVTGSQYLHDSDLNQLSVFGQMEVRLFRGFSVNMFGSYAWVRDQLNIEKGGLTTQEILLRQRAQETSFNYFTSFGITYRFGSIFNNVVNPRFGGGGGGGMMIIG